MAVTKSMQSLLAFVLVLFVAVACGSDKSGDPAGDDTAAGGDTDGVTDQDPSDGVTPSDSDPSGDNDGGDGAGGDNDPIIVPPSADLRRCSTSGDNGITGDLCFLMTPVEAGLPATGTNADTDQYALRPLEHARGTLMIFLNASGSAPKNQIATPESNFYGTARDAGFNVLALAYRSNDVIGLICSGDDGCYLPTRTSVLTGEVVDGAASQLDDITPDEGVYARAAAALVKLAELDPSGGWDAFVDTALIATPELALDWAKIAVSGHSQGGGHATLLAKLHPVERVIALSSPCDAVDGSPVAWLDNAEGWATDTTTRFYGLDTASDPICSSYQQAWDNLGVPANAGHGDAIGCGGGASGHGASINCESNAPTWVSFLE